MLNSRSDKGFHRLLLRYMRRPAWGVVDAGWRRLMMVRGLCRWRPYAILIRVRPITQRLTNSPRSSQYGPPHHRKDLLIRHLTPGMRPTRREHVNRLLQLLVKHNVQARQGVFGLLQGARADDDRVDIIVMKRPGSGQLAHGDIAGFGERAKSVDDVQAGLAPFGLVHAFVAGG